MGFTATIFTLDYYAQWLLNIIFRAEKEVFDLIINFIDELLIANKWISVFS
jgi:hypothetical protein|tara:strand:- start:1772 stop:1924 length:153 start_codon:yes stop_codon:yes gene_type:complete